MTEPKPNPYEEMLTPDQRNTIRYVLKEAIESMTNFPAVTSASPEGNDAINAWIQNTGMQIGALNFLIVSAIGGDLTAATYAQQYAAGLARGRLLIETDAKDREQVTQTMEDILFDAIELGHKLDTRP